MNVDKILEIVEERINRFRAYLKVLDEFEARNKTPNKFYYRGRLDELEFWKEFFLQMKKK